MESNYLSVSAANALVKDTIDQEPLLRHLFVKGEISSYKSYPSAVYFDIKDEKSLLSCIMWGDEALYLPFQPKIGDEVIAEGSISVYPQRGRYQLYVRSLSLFGQGNALLQLEALKNKLAKEGLFDPSRKRAIPLFPKKVGIIVGEGSAAESDLLKNISRRFPLTEIVIFPSLVQGKDAPKDLLRAFLLSQKSDVDTLIIARGGGSNEDLSAFNDEKLVRAVATSKMPTISAIGHEIDFTLVDFVADKRVSTPTGAAEAAVPDEKEIRQRLLDASSTLLSSLSDECSSLEERLTSLSSRPFFTNPSSMYQKAKDDLAKNEERLLRAEKQTLSIKRENLLSLEAHLKALNPYGVLSRGYSLTTNANGQIIKSVKEVKAGDKIKTRLKDGIINNSVEGVQHD
jgi:exodeoxyribonuclease VII large subunit